MSVPSGALVKREFKLSDITVICWILRVVDETGKESFWFKGHDIANFLGYSRPNQAILDNVKQKWKQSWLELKGTLFACTLASLNVPLNWQPNSVFISEPGLYALITRSKLPEAEKFTDWIYEEVLPALRKDGHFKIAEKLSATENQLVVANRKIIEYADALVQANINAEKARQDAVVLSHRLADIAQDVIAKPSSQKLLHALAVHELGENPREIAFTRCQRRSLSNALKRLAGKNPGAREIYRNGYVPNGVNVLNCVKDCLKQADIPYTAKNNIITVLNNMNADEIVSSKQ